jgi:hypothetical protein
VLIIVGRGPPTGLGRPILSPENAQRTPGDTRHRSQGRPQFGQPSRNARRIDLQQPSVVFFSEFLIGALDGSGRNGVLYNW